jgi:hypothetical protein
MGHPVGGWTGGEETRVMSIYAFISTNPSAISLAICIMQGFSYCVYFCLSICLK